MGIATAHVSVGYIDCVVPRDERDQIEYICRIPQ